MTDFLVFSDFHAHNFQAFSKQVPWPTGGSINSRLKDCVDVIEEMRAYAKQHNIKHVLFGGDLFHSRSAVKTEVFNVIYEAVNAWADDLAYMFMIPGNHDMADREGHVHSLKAFRRENLILMDQNWHALYRPEIKVQIIGVPYTPDREEAARRLERVGKAADDCKAKYGAPSILLAHLGMQGAKVGSDYVLVSDNDVTVSDIPHDKFALCLFGHYHQHQQLFSNGWFIGATHHHNWGDAGTRRGFLHLTVNPDGTHSFKQIETKAPRFVNLDDQNTGAWRKQDFIRMHTSLEVTDELKQGLVATLGPNVEVVRKPVKQDEQTFELKEEDLHPAGLVGAWVEKKHGNLDAEKLKSIGLSLLSKAESRSL